jgi:serine/threonine-protein kinase
MFLRGAYASSRFTHPRVVSVSIDGTEADGTPFIVRPWVDAEPLDAVVGRSDTGLSEVQALRIAEQVLDALEIAHAHGIVHGAITPRNVLVTPRGSIRLCDFAIPPGHGPRNSDDEDVLASRRVGPFAAPERCGNDAGAASEQTDIYMLAACLYFAVTKEPPRGKAEGSVELAKERARPIKEVCAKLSDGFGAIVDHALSVEPEARFESAYAMLGDVRRVMAGRKPKLGDARKPVPSGSFSSASISQSQRDGAVSSGRPKSTLRTDYAPRSTSRARGQGSDPWKGNFALILAIAALVGVATFVMVREKVEESRVQEQEELLKKQHQPKPESKDRPQETAP